MLLTAMSVILPACGHTELGGQPADTEEADDDPGYEEDVETDVGEEDAEEEILLCGNGRRDPGEECDGEFESCDNRHCGGGTRQCTPDCTWGVCDEAVFGVQAGPVTASGDVVTWSHRNDVIWEAGSFNFFFRDEEGLSFYSRMTSDGMPLLPPTLVEPGHLVEDGVVVEVSAAPTFRDYPFAVLFGTATEGVYLDFVDLEGALAQDPGISLNDGRDGQGTRFLSSKEESLLIFEYRYVSMEAALQLMTHEGIPMNSHRPACWETIEGSHSAAIAEATGYIVFWWCCVDQRNFLYYMQMQYFDDSGLPMDEPGTVVETIKTDPDDFSAASAGSSHGIAYSEFDPDVWLLSDFKFAILDREGGVRFPPVMLSTVSPAVYDPPNGDVVWTGSEYGVAYARMEASELHGEERTTVMLERFDETGERLGEPVIVEDGFRMSNIALVWTGSQYGLSWHKYPGINLFGEIRLATLGCEAEPGP